MEDVVAATRSAAARFEPKNAAAIFVVVVVGVMYFSRYYSHGFNVGDEGSVVLITARLLAGERPYIDVEPGYGLLWYYPLLLLFKITGVNFIATRVFFMSLALITSLLAFATIRLQTRKSGLAVAAALMILFVPGTLHKAYIPLIVVANMLSLTWVGLNAAEPKLNRVVAASLVAAVSYQIRPDVGLCAGLVLIASLIAGTMNHSQSWRKTATSCLRHMGLMAAGALAVISPLILVAAVQGFLSDFMKRAAAPFSLLSVLFNLLRSGTVTELDPEIPAGAGTTLARASLTAMWQEGPHRVFALLTYLPLVTVAMIAALAVVMVLRGHRARPVEIADTVQMFGLVALAYSAFLQFFLFRPDPAHVSQFMPGYIVLMCVFLGRWLLPGHKNLTGDHGSGVHTSRLGHLVRLIFAGIVIFHIGLYAWFGLHQPGAGSIALARGRTERFHGSNGIDVFVTPGEKRLFTAVTRVVEQNTNEHDVVLCFPYCPGFNVLTNRSTFARKLYVDDAMLILDPEWQRRMVGRIQDERPSLIIIGNMAYNRTEISRFENWATEVMEHIVSEYTVVERIGSYKFYVRILQPSINGFQNHENTNPEP